MLFSGQASCELPVQYVNPQNITVGGSQVATVGLSKSRYKRAVPAEGLISCNEDAVRCVDITCFLSNLRKEQSVMIKVSCFIHIIVFWLKNCIYLRKVFIFYLQILIF